MTFMRSKLGRSGDTTPVPVLYFWGRQPPSLGGSARPGGSARHDREGVRPRSALARRGAEGGRRPDRPLGLD